MCPILFHVGPISVGAYGVAILLGYFTAFFLIPRYSRRAGLDAAVARRMLFFVFVIGALGGRTFQVVQRLPDVIANPNPFFWLLQQGGVWYGSILGGVLTAFVLTKRWKLQWWTVFDVFAGPAALAGGIGRLGCLMSGCCWGAPSDLPWAITYTNDVAHRLHPALPWTPVHPWPVYELVAAVIITALLDRAWRWRRRAGEIGLLWIALYGVARSILEIFRADPLRGTLLGVLSTSQEIGLATALIAAVALVVRRTRRREGPDEENLHPRAAAQ